MKRRPVYDRFLQRKHHMPLDPPTDAEKRDAIVVLHWSKGVLGWEEDAALYKEAFLIFDEAGE